MKIQQRRMYTSIKGRKPKKEVERRISEDDMHLLKVTPVAQNIVILLNVITAGLPMNPKAHYF